MFNVVDITALAYHFTYSHIVVATRVTDFDETWHIDSMWCSYKLARVVRFVDQNYRFSGYANMEVTTRFILSRVQSLRSIRLKT